MTCHVVLFPPYDLDRLISQEGTMELAVGPRKKYDARFPNKAHAPYINDFCGERFHWTVGNEFFRRIFSTKVYGSLAVLHKDLDGWL